jgi:hypothetical protein
VDGSFGLVARIAAVVRRTYGVGRSHRRFDGQTATTSRSFLEGLIGGAERKNGWQLAEYAGDPAPWRMQGAEDLAAGLSGDEWRRLWEYAPGKSDESNSAQTSHRIGRRFNQSSVTIEVSLIS